MVVRPKPRSTRLLVVVLVSISLAVITVDYRQGPDGPLASLGELSLELMAPLQRSVTNVTSPVRDFFVSIANLPSLSDENEQLKQRLADASADISQVAAMQAELEQLHRLLDLQDRFDFPLVTSLVIGIGPSNFENVDHDRLGRERRRRRRHAGRDGGGHRSASRRPRGRGLGERRERAAHHRPGRRHVGTASSTRTRPD